MGYELSIMFTNQALAGFISFLGIAGNTINIIVYCRQGFQDTVNISLLGLAVSDLLSLVTSLWVSICWNPLLYYADVDFISEDVEFLTGSLPHLLFTRVTAWITAFVAFERCLCVSLPLHVKTIVTPRRVAAYIVMTFVVVTIAQAPSFYTSGLQWVYNTNRNRTVLSRVVRENGEEIDSITYSVNLLSPFGSFVIVVVCTAITSLMLNRKSKWREQSRAVRAGKGTQKEESDVSLKEKKVIRLVVFVSVIFIVSFLPANVIQIIYCSISSKPQLVWLYWQYLSIAFSFIKVLEAFNASVSVLIYYKMSSNFRAGFHQLFFWWPYISDIQM